jgi:hypothetical protein
MPARRLDCGLGRESVYLEGQYVRILKPGCGKTENNVLGKCTRQRLLAADLLAANEGLDSDGDGTVNVLGGTVLRQAHLAESLGNTHNGFQMTDLNK